VPFLCIRNEDAVAEFHHARICDGVFISSSDFTVSQKLFRLAFIKESKPVGQVRESDARGADGS
jgi:hypothetical protein